MRRIFIAASLCFLALLTVQSPLLGENKHYDIDIFLAHLPEYINRFKSGDSPGSYSYLPGAPKADLYGSSDMIYLLYSLNMLELSDADKRQWARQIRKFQNAKTGWFGGNATLHGKEHALAYAIGALKLLGARPEYPLTFADKYMAPEDIARMFDETPWDAVWSGSHIASGIASAFINTGLASDEWLSEYFNWLELEVDPETGYWMRRNDGSKKEKATNHELGGAFHYYYIYTFSGRPLPYPERIIDATLSVQQPNGLYDGEIPYCIDLDGVFSLIRAFRQTDGYRRQDVESSVERTLVAIASRLNDPEFVRRSYKDSHKLVGAIVALAEIQGFMPEKLRTPKPLLRSLDFSPFI
ncbi:MAG TPA: hypothetical protein PLK80_10860 [bacterium]|nr:hypothetical protein [bacterium]